MALWFILLMSFRLLEPEPEQKEELATVIVFRGSGYGTQRFDLWVEDYPVLEPMKNNMSVRFQVPAGDLKLQTKKRQYLQRGLDYVIKVEAGVVYYLKAELEYTFPVTRLKLTVSNSEQYGKVEPKLEKIMISGTPTRDND